MAGQEHHKLHENGPAENKGSHWKPSHLGLFIEDFLLVLISFFVSLAVINFVGLLKPFRIGPTAYTIKIQDPDVQTTAPLEEAVFFQNGDSTLSEESKKLLIVITKLTDCPSGVSMRITPWVSSAEYKNDPDGAKNYDLAKKRARAVTEFLKNENHSIHISGKTWDSFGDIRAHLLFKDTRSDPYREAIQEQLNRRVDIRIERGCTAPPVTTGGP